mgnify:CR=1 FL=1
MAVKLYKEYLKRKGLYFPNVKEEEWNDWKWQVRNRVQSAKDLEKYINLDSSECVLLFQS